MPTTTTSDVLAIGGGIIGLSIAYEFASRGDSVTLLERSEPGREASWAGAGILPPASWYSDHGALDTLAVAATRHHAGLSQRLLDETGIDDEYIACGAIYQETTDNENYLTEAFARWRQLGVVVERTDDDWHVTAEAQVRNPRRLCALLKACEHLGVRIETGSPVERIRKDAHGRITSVESSGRSYSAAAYCFAAGAWTPALVEAAGSLGHGRPIRGQMLLLQPTTNRLTRIVHRYPYYAVPRRDGRVLVGATVEDAGFEKATTEEAKRELLAAAVAIDPSLASARLERHWSGLRPASGDALPLIGPMPGVGNAWLATGHHRCGLQLA
ncbi:MAG: FAD-dependent oxidoreductase, partial [Planctomycetota bacterium]